MSQRPIHEIEAKWQAQWEKEGTYRAADPGKTKAGKFYGLIEFPYPSGDGLHVGHPRSYTAIDVLTRKRRMEGKNVLYPIGWDAFGLPTENYAIKNKVKPQDATAKNVATFTRQIKSLGFGFDWSREINTTDPAYYKWTQWQFLQFFKHGLAYKAKTTINWCPKDKIGLANEEVVNGCCERCGTPVEKREKEQWMIAITKYAERLLSDLDQVDYLDKIKAQQINWIGKSEGAYVDFKMGDDTVRVFTTRPDTLFGATYLVLAPEHPMVSHLASRISHRQEIDAYIEQARKKTDIERTNEEKEKTGVQLKGVTAVNPANGEEIPVWVSDYVLAQYGTGAIMAVPAHDERDFAFAKAFGLPIRQVVEPDVEHFLGIGVVLEGKDDRLIFQKRDNNAPESPNMITHFGGGKEKTDVSGVACAIREMKEELELELKESDLSYIGTFKKEHHPGKYSCMYEVKGVDPKRLIVHEGEGISELSVEAALTHEKVPEYTKGILRTLFGKGIAAFTNEGVAVNSDFLDGLPSWKAKQDMISWLEEKGTGERATTYKLRDWVFSRQRYWGEPIPIIHCAKCGSVPVPDDQLPVVLPDVEAYQPTDTGESPLAKIRDWVEVKCPKCGGEAERETDTMPNWAGSSWYFLRYCDPHNDKELASQEAMKYWMPVDLYNGGMEHTVLHLLYSRFWYKFLWDIGVVPKECGSEPYRVRRSHGLVLAEGGEKMSKSKGNVVNPDDVVSRYGADVFRLYELFMGPFDQPVPWDTNGIEGVKKFLDKVWHAFENVASNPFNNDEAETLYHQTVKKITEGIDTLHFNTCVSQLMILTNAFTDANGIPESMRAGFIQLLAPFAPHLAEELWQQIGQRGSVHRSGWPSYDSGKLKGATFELVVQVNGKVRAKIKVPSDVGEDEAKAKAQEAAVKWLEGKTPSKIVYIQGRLVSIVV